MSPARRYTQSFKRAAITRLHDAGYPDQLGALMQVALEFDIPSSTLRYWFQNPHQPVRRRALTPRSNSHAATTNSDFSASLSHIPLAISHNTAATNAPDFAPFPASSWPQPSATNATAATTHAPIIDPAQINPHVLLTFYSAELAQISTILHAHRETASYKDLFATFRLLSADIEALKLRIQYEEQTNESLDEQLIKALEQFTGKTLSDIEAESNAQPVANTASWDAVQIISEENFTPPSAMP